MPNHRAHNIAVILAGGSGTRFGDALPKQFRQVAGKKIIEHTIEAFENHAGIDEIAIVCQPQYAATVGQMLIDNRYSKVKKVLDGGSERYHSSLNAIAAYDDDETNLLLHDAVRPLVSARIISDCLCALERYNAVSVATKTTDTIIEVDDTGRITHIPDRDRLRNAQTPQCFKRGVIARAYELAMRDPDFRATDDCGVVRHYLPDEPIHVVDGEPFNIKVTYAEDLFLVEKLHQLKSQKDKQHEQKTETI